MQVELLVPLAMHYCSHLGQASTCQHPCGLHDNCHHEHQLWPDQQPRQIPTLTHHTHVDLHAVLVPAGPWVCPSHCHMKQEFVSLSESRVCQFLCRNWTLDDLSDDTIFSAFFFMALQCYPI